MTENKLEPKEMTFVHADTETPPSVVLVSATLGGAPSLKVTPPLVLHESFSGESSRRLTKRAEQIYDTMSFKQ